MTDTPPKTDWEIASDAVISHRPAVPGVIDTMVPPAAGAEAVLPPWTVM